MDTITKNPITEEEVEEFLLFLYTSDNVKCEAKHQRIATGESMGACGTVAEYRAFCDNHINPTWKQGKNVCIAFAKQVEDPNHWCFIPI